MDLKEEMEKITKYFESLTPEQYITDVLCLNGIMTQELLDDVFTNITPYSSDGICFSDEEVEKHKKFMEVFNYIETYTEKKYPSKKIDVTECFCEYEIDFTYKDKFYRWGLLLGQGAYCGIYALEKSDDAFRLELDTSLRYYKVIK